MKRLLFLLLFIQINSFSQSWNYSSGVDSFDGKFKTSSIKGKGSDFPYSNPQLHINKFDNGNINFYVSEAGYFPKNSNLKTLWVFDSEPNTIYSCDDLSLSRDSKTLFFRDFTESVSKSKVSMFEIFEKLINANKVEIRVTNSYSMNQLTFSLSGSSKAINYVVGLENIKRISIENRNKKNINLSIQLKVDSLKNKFLKILENQLIIDTHIKMMSAIFEDELIRNNYFGLNNYDSITIEPIIEGLRFTERVKIYYTLKDFPFKDIVDTHKNNTWKIKKESPIYKLADKIIDKKKKLNN
tara:strand:+ start:63 stop:956 length:894 start_codon:yes stop_codon:yes gene_type:complete